MKNLDITFDKYLLSNLINRPYDFSQLRNKIKNITFFDYDDNKTDTEIVKDIETKIQSLNNHFKNN